MHCGRSPRFAAEGLKSARRHRALVPHYYDAQQEGELKPFKVGMRARGHPLELWSGAGVFSKERLDAGTSLLADECVLEPHWRVHDLGCGIGVVGIVVKRTHPSCAVLCSDVSERAVALARKNAAQLGLDIEVRISDGYVTIPERFDTVLLNPPYVAGRKVVFSLLEQAHAHLVDEGLLQVVARHNKGGAMIREKLAELFGNCDDSRRRGGYRIYVAKKRAEK
jgi:16S rRNA G1207 methylase RsmC